MVRTHWGQNIMLLLEVLREVDRVCVVFVKICGKHHMRSIVWKAFRRLQGDFTAVSSFWLISALMRSKNFAPGPGCHMACLYHVFLVRGLVRNRSVSSDLFRQDFTAFFAFLHLWLQITQWH
jgi:hypothetical protein